MCAQYLQHAVPLVRSIEDRMANRCMQEDTPQTYIYPDRTATQIFANLHCKNTYYQKIVSLSEKMFWVHILQVQSALETITEKRTW
jgi:hypothetical protein